MATYEYDCNWTISEDALDLKWLGGISYWVTNHALLMPRHRHPFKELIICLKGAHTYEIDGVGDVTVNEGTGMIVPDRALHVIKGGVDTSCERVGLYILPRLRRDASFSVFSDADLRQINAMLNARTAVPFRLDKPLAQSVRELAALTKLVGSVRSTRENPRPRSCFKSAAVSETRGDGSHSIDLGYVRTLATAILYRTVDILNRPLAPVTPQLMSEAVRFLEANYARKLSADDLAVHMGYGRTQLFELFKKHTGLTPNEYLTRLRVKKATELLRGSRISVAEVAAATGFASVGYFRRVYAKYTGKVPA